MSGRTMINGVKHNGFASEEEHMAAVKRAAKNYKPGEAFTVLGPHHPDVIRFNGEQYAKLPEGWPAAEAKDLEEAHAEAVAAEDRGELYDDWSPEDIKDFVETFTQLLRDHFDVLQEVAALRKGMKTMQRKTRKQNQVQRRLERRLAQARSRRDALIADDEAAKTINAYMKSLEEMAAGKGVVVREGK